MDTLSTTFKNHGIVFIPNLISADNAEMIKKEILQVLYGKYSKAIAPDKIKWRPGDGESVVKSVCNAWKSSNIIEDFVYSISSIYEYVSVFTRWQSIKLNQDSVLVVPKGAPGVTFHFDNAYQDWHDPGEVVTLWISLSNLEGSQSSALAYVENSHEWECGTRVSMFTGQQSTVAEMQGFADRYGYTVLIKSFKYGIGDASIHDGRLWHGSFANDSGTDRFAFALHLMNGDSTFSHSISPYFSRYRLNGTNRMDETFFPTVWRKT